MTGPSLTGPSRCGPIEELLAPFALHAVEPEEHHQVERHLADCPRCAFEVGGFRESAAMLAIAGGLAPAGVWEGIAAGLAPPPLRRLRRSVRPRPAGLLAVAAVALLALGSVALMGRSGGDVAGSPRLSSSALAALSDPAADDIWLRSFDGDLTARVVRDHVGRGVVLTGGLPALPDGRAYQLWALPGLGEPFPVTLLGRHPDAIAFEHHGALVGFAITDEPAAGALSPSGAPVVAGRLPTGLH